ncbi:PREDICTED: N-myc proto-oncogene protein-like [Ficedula albicollis]|uniref:N-myc proto-oncogene protein-like n=1 Tax=Ficedula albicollis TaxID=59894 RepID=UPI0003592ABD|nr:PREDICTED: N-myc proto-oncogene protein-like [Ficedula albicollis]
MPGAISHPPPETCQARHPSEPPPTPPEVSCAGREEPERGPRGRLGGERARAAEPGLCVSAACGGGAEGAAAEEGSQPEEIPGRGQAEGEPAGQAAPQAGAAEGLRSSGEGELCYRAVLDPLEEHLPVPESPCSCHLWAQGWLWSSPARRGAWGAIPAASCRVMFIVRLVV